MSTKSFLQSSLTFQKPSNRRCSLQSINSNGENICKICHSETERDDELITPCYCSGSLLYVHQGCVQKWIKATDAKSCELCNYNYKVNSTVKPFIEVIINNILLLIQWIMMSDE